MNQNEAPEPDPQKGKDVIKEWKLGNKLIFYEMPGCISCAFLLPLLSHADRMHMFDEIEVLDFDTKLAFKEEIKGILESYGKSTKNIPSPVILMQKQKDAVKLLVEPDTVAECAQELMDALNRLGDGAVLQYMDGELDHKILFNNLVLKLATNIIYPKDYKRNGK